MVVPSEMVGTGAQPHVESAAARGLRDGQLGGEQKGFLSDTSITRTARVMSSVLPAMAVSSVGAFHAACGAGDAVT
jgi:hypothetical protein